MKEITAAEVKDALPTKHIIDVREVDEVAGGKIPGAIHIPLGLLEFRMHELDKNKVYTMVCRSGGRSGKAAQLLESHGYTVFNMVGGMLAWDRPIE
ncbi:rhodanese-like domain-containing protein [Sporosarcina sp. Te-1]|uniref:rhodanese-like domain-containing protein n=1 Tax=Sporosarcina sp. Te-1 TaxID=2818390 RepID=UPI001A9D9D31|nr:rhodanese-like domain-containing protein [Sporosarcina sp. Te-1]QTD40399.1 rhodanese-like domain-containing protein [Sporosarcina sp. Te-1]